MADMFVPSSAYPRQRPSLMTDPAAPCSTTADGRNPWPSIWFDRMKAGEPVPSEWQAAVQAEAARRGESIAVIDIW